MGPVESVSLEVESWAKHLVNIRSYLCLTKYTQNSVLLGLLHWQSLASHEELVTVLSKFIFVGEVEIVKFLGDIFDSLFGFQCFGSGPRNCPGPSL